MMFYSIKHVLHVKLCLNSLIKILSLSFVNEKKMIEKIDSTRCLLV